MTNESSSLNSAVDTKGSVELMRMARASGNNERAEGYADQTIALDPDNAEAWLVKAHSANALSNIENDRAKEVFECCERALGAVATKLPNVSAGELSVFAESFDLIASTISERYHQLGLLSGCGHDVEFLGRRAASNLGKAGSTLKLFQILHRKELDNCVAAYEANGLPATDARYMCQILADENLISGRINRACGISFLEGIMLAFEKEEKRFSKDLRGLGVTLKAERREKSAAAARTARKPKSEIDFYLDRLVYGPIQVKTAKEPSRPPSSDAESKCYKEHTARLSHIELSLHLATNFLEEEDVGKFTDFNNAFFGDSPEKQLDSQYVALAAAYEFKIVLLKARRDDCSRTFTVPYRYNFGGTSFTLPESTPWVTSVETIASLDKAIEETQAKRDDAIWACHPDDLAKRNEYLEFARKFEAELVAAKSGSYPSSKAQRALDRCRKEIGSLNEELGGLGLLDGKRKKELRARIKGLEEEAARHESAVIAEHEAIDAGRKKKLPEIERRLNSSKAIVTATEVHVLGYKQSFPD